MYISHLVFMTGDCHIWGTTKPPISVG